MFEGAQRKEIADHGYDQLSSQVDTIITIPNDRVLQITDKKTSLMDAFDLCDDVLRHGVQGISELITVPGLINVDFADVRSIMTGGGVSVISVGESKGHNRVQEAIDSTLQHALLDVDYAGAQGVLLHVTGGPDLTLGEVNDIGHGLTEAVDPSATVIWGSRILPEYEGKIEVIGIFTGVLSAHIKGAAAHVAGESGEKERVYSELEIKALF